MANANDVRIELSANAARLKRDMDQARSVVETGVRGMTSALGALGVGFGAVQTVRFFKSLIDDADALSKLAQKTNMAVEQVAGWSHALDLAGVSQEALQKTAKSVSSQMLDASRGLKEAQHNWAALDIDIKKNDGSLKSVNRILLEVADKYANATDKTMMMGLMTKVLGKSALDLIPALKDGSGALAQLIAEGQALNPVTEESARQAELFNDNLKRVEKSATTTAISLLNNLLPAMAAITDEMAKAATSKDGGFWAALLAGAQTALTGDDMKKNLRERARLAQQMGAAEKALEINRKSFGDEDQRTNAVRESIVVLRERMQVAMNYYKVLQQGAAREADSKKKDPFTPRNTDLAGASKAAAEMKKLLAIGESGEIEALKARAATLKGEMEAINDLKNERAAEDKRLLALGEEGELAAHIARVERIKGEMEAINDYRNSTLTATNEMTEFWKSAAQSMQQSMSGFFFDVMQGNLFDLSGSFKRSIDQMVANVLAAKAATALFGKDFGKDDAPIGGLIGKGLEWLGMPKFASGGAFTVGGAGGTDSQLVRFMATPGERVSVQTPAQQRGGAAMPGMTLIQNFTINGPADTRSQSQIAAAALNGAQRALIRNF